MAFPTIIFNASSGSDTQASGAGPATALFGTNASFAGSVWTLDGSPDLSGVATDGSAVIWANTDSGRQFFTINTVDNGAKTVTTDDAPAGTSTGRTWGIGGKRATLDAASNRTLFTTSGAKPGWSIDLEADTYTLTSSLAISCNGTGTNIIRIFSSSGSAPVITSATNSVILLSLGCNQVSFENLKLTHTAATRGVGINATSTSIFNCLFKDIEIDGCARGIVGDFIIGWSFYNCVFLNIEIHNCTSHAIHNSNYGNIWVNIYAHDNAGSGFYSSTALTTSLCDAYVACNFSNNALRGYHLDTSAPLRTMLFQNCIIYGNTGNGIDLLGANNKSLLLNNNIIYGNGGFGVAVDGDYPIGTNNAYGNNSSGDREGFSAFNTDLALSADPFTNPGSDDYSLNNTVGGGAVCKQAGFPGISYMGTGYLDIGAIQSQGSGGGGSTEHSAVF